MGKFFTRTEIIKSMTAYKHGIDNTPKDEQIYNNIDILIEFMDGVRLAWGSAIIVTSGYRCKELNEIVGGVKNSAHQYGFAIDCVPANNKKIEFFEFFKNYLEENKLDFDELILESNGNSIWIHFSLFSYQGKQRKKIKTIKK